MSSNGKNEPSKVELAKGASRALRGTIAEMLHDAQTSHFAEDDKQLLKFHGVYQQDDRDKRQENKKAGLDKAWMFMARVAIPGGVLSADQWLALDELADSCANGSLRLTTRQGVQFHGVLKGDLQPLIASINQALLTTLSACGDVERNVMATPAPIDDEVHREVQRLARDIARELRPATGAYHEIWIDGEKVLTSEDGKPDPEPFYGTHYLPRKFKTAIALDTDNSVDAWSNDCALIAITEAGRVKGYNLLAGGGLGMTHKKADTFARLASPLAFVKPEHAVEAVRAVASVFRDHGNRADRRHARLKYLMEEWGLERFRAELQNRVAWRLEDPLTLPPPRHLDYLGRYDQGDGRQFYGVFVENGRVDDGGGNDIRSALREIAAELRPGFRITPTQSVLLTDLEPAKVDRALEILAEHNVPTVERLSNARRFSMACPALPTCGLALAESERVMHWVVDAIEEELERLGLGDVELTIRMTGCPNGCARPYNADIGLVGRKPGVYHVFIGGGLGGDRMADLFASDVDSDELVGALRPLLERFKANRRRGEGLGDFYQRVFAPARDGEGEVRTLITGDELPTQGRFIQLSVEAS
jgi:sulfite reductase beta subunit-like hemoprotein